MTKSYVELLRDPRWQKRRLSVLEAAEFKCANCGSATETLHVHHINYTKGAKPWDYPDDKLRCLCESCHENVSLAIPVMRDVMSKLPVEVLDQLMGFAIGLHQVTNRGETLDEFSTRGKFGNMSEDFFDGVRRSGAFG